MVRLSPTERAQLDAVFTTGTTPTGQLVATAAELDALPAGTPLLDAWGSRHLRLIRPRLAYDPWKSLDTASLPILPAQVLATTALSRTAAA